MAYDEVPVEKTTRGEWLAIAGFVLAVAVGSAYYFSLPSKLDAQQAAPVQQTGLSDGVTAPSFELKDGKGQVINLADHKGKVVWLNFWATYCPPCRQEMPNMERLQQQYKGQGLVILAINAGAEPPKMVNPFVENMKLTFPILFDPKGDVTTEYKISGLPASFFVDREGKIHSQHIGGMSYKDMEKAIAPLL